LRAIADQWRFGGTRIPEVSDRREAFNIMLSMPAGTDVRVLRQAAREFAKAELANHRSVMVLHTHQANPHVHISVRACRRSLSGFTVVFHRNNHAGRELGWYLVIGFGLACCAFILLRAGWWGGGVVVGPRLYAGL
jgi:hypothetical protein